MMKKDRLYAVTLYLLNHGKTSASELAKHFEVSVRTIQRDIRNRSAIYVSTRTKHKVSEILHLLGNESTRLTALADNMLRFVIGIYRDELNYLHEKKNNRQPF